MKRLIILLIAIPHFIIAQVKNKTIPKRQISKSIQNRSSKSRFSNVKANSNKIATTDFDYDAVGNVTKDLTQGISNIEYDSFSRMEQDPYLGRVLPVSFHLPRLITFTDGRKIENQYDASGNKLLTQLFVNNVVKVEYAYEEDETYMRTPGKDWKLIEMRMDEGRLVPKSENSTEMVYEYDIQDHTGSPRVSFRENTITGQPEIVRKQDYDPFGLPLTGADYQSPSTDTLSKKYFFNGKEYLVTLGLKMYDYGMRTYNPRLGRYYQIDPKASLMPSWSPYSFSFNNPIRYRDYDGQIPYPITIRAFAPFSSFGFGFHGDNRGYSTSSSATARVHQQINFDTDKSGVSARAWSSPTFLTANPSGSERAIPSVSFTKGLSIGTKGDSKTFEFGTSVAAANPKTPAGTPDINIFSNFSISENKKSGSLTVSGTLTGDNFPSTEAFIKDPSGKSVFLGIGQIAEGVGRNTGPFTELPGENSTNPITSFNITITTDKKGNFTGVQSGGVSYSISDWNKNFTNTQTQK